ncbi:MAG: DMT family transporter [Promethearchaeota archaeon]|nr:MAG: DMT family transporter [Candidatus Lokiarchaeota archaeon]
MEAENLKKGIFFGVIGAVLIGLQPVVANSRPESIDPYMFAAMTVIVEALIFFPIMMLERRKIKNNYNGNLNPEELDSLLNGYRKNLPLLLFVGSAFAVGMIMFFIGYQLAGAINGSLAQKSTVFFALFFGWLILHEKITKKQLFFSILLFFGLVLAVTQASFNILELNLGVIILLLMSLLWMFTHTITKPLFEKKEATPAQMVCMRNAIGGLILFSTYFLFYPAENIIFYFEDSINVFWFILMGAVYSCGLFCWYKCLYYLNVSKASILVSPTPIVTAFFATLFLGEFFTFFHFIGTIVIVFSIYMIMREKQSEI